MFTLSFTLLSNGSLTTTTSSFIRFYCYLHGIALQAHKALKIANKRGGLRAWREAFSAHSALAFWWIQKYIYIYIYLHQYQQRSSANSSQASIIFTKFRFDSGPPAAGSLRSNRQREWAGVTPALIVRSHGLCVLGRSCACVRACLLPLWSSGRAEAARLGIVSSLLPSLPLSLLHSRYNILAAPM